MSPARYRPFAFATLLFLGTSAAAQSINPRTSEELQEDAKEVLAAGAPLARTGTGLTASSFQISTSNGEQEIALALDFDLFTTTPTNTSTPGEYRVSSLDLTVTGVAPLSERSDDEASFFSGNSVIGGSRLTVAMTYLTALQKDARGISPTATEIVSACAKSQARVWAGNSLAKIEVAERYVSEVNKTPPPGETIQSYIRLKIPENDATLSDVASAVASVCTGKDLVRLSQEYAPGAVAELNRAAFSEEPLLFFGGEATIGDADIDVFDQADFEVTTVSRTPWEVGAYAGLIGPELQWSARIKASYGRSFEAAEAEEFCRTVMMSSDPECVEGPSGDPVKTNSSFISIEGRRLFRFKDGRRIAIAPQVTYDVEIDEFDIDVPVYFAPDENNKLSGGLIARYDSERDDVSFGIFVSTPFSVFF